MLTYLIDLIGQTNRLREVAEHSTRVILDTPGWTGTIVRSHLDARTGRSARLADLTRAVGADTYTCGCGGARYLDPAAFETLGLDVDYFGTARGSTTLLIQPDPCVGLQPEHISAAMAGLDQPRVA